MLKLLDIQMENTSRYSTELMKVGLGVRLSAVETEIKKWEGQTNPHLVLEASFAVDGNLGTKWSVFDALSFLWWVRMCRDDFMEYTNEAAELIARIYKLVLARN